MEFSIFVEVVGGMLTTLGGWEAVKYFVNLKTNRRKAEAEADSVEFSVIKDTVTFLQNQLHEQVKSDSEKETRFTEQTQRLRDVQDDNYKLLQEKSRLELELQKYRCIRKLCEKREPQNGY